jgi:hypothetical protein
METRYITPEHLKTLITVIDMVTERGALKGPELMTVSELRNNLSLELESFVAEQQRLEQERMIRLQQEEEARKLKEEQDAFLLKKKFADERLRRREVEKELAQIKMIPEPVVDEQEVAELNTLAQARSVEDVKSSDTGQVMEFKFIEKELEEEKVLQETQQPIESEFSIPQPVTDKPRRKAREMANLVSGRITGSEPQVTSSNVPPVENPVSSVEEVQGQEFDFEKEGDWISEDVKEENVGLQAKEHDEWLEKHGTDDVNEALKNIADELESVETEEEVQEEPVPSAVDDAASVMSGGANDDLLRSLAQDIEVNTYDSIEELEQKIAEKNANAEEDYEEFEEIVIPDSDDLQGMTKSQIKESADALGFEVDTKKTKQIMMVDFNRQAEQLIAELTEQGAEISTD